MSQRFMDIFFSGLAILALSPLLLPIFLILRVTAERQVFYRQDRVGLNGTIFRVLKFATMKIDSPRLPGGTVTVKDDPRVLPVGKFLRKTKINELPQLLNIFLGDMSFIGPRPLTLETFKAYSNNVQNTIITVRPGLSGIGSIIFRDEESLFSATTDTHEFYENVIAPYKGELECWYVKNKNMSLFISLIFLTIFVVLFPRSKIIWRLFHNIPSPPPALSALI